MASLKKGLWEKKLDDKILSTLRWSLYSSDPARSSGEIVQEDTWLMSRIWTTPAILKSIPLPTGFVRVILSVDGDARITSEDGTATDLLPGQVVFFLSDSCISVENYGLWARVEWQMQSTVLQGEYFFKFRGKPISLRSVYGQVLLAITNTVVASNVGDLGAGAGFLKSSLELCITAAVADAVSDKTSLTVSQRSLFISAIDLIDKSYMNPLFGVSEVAERIGVSERYLNMVFSNAGTTVRNEIESRRVTLAKSLLESTFGRKNSEEIAFRSGFRSKRQMTSSISRQRRKYEEGASGL